MLTAYRRLYLQQKQTLTGCTLPRSPWTAEPFCAYRALTNPPLILTDVVIAGHKHFHDKQHGDKQTACNTAARRPGKSVWIPYRKRRFQNQGNQGGKSWDVCQERWLARPPAGIVHRTSLIAGNGACAERKAWKSLALGEAGVQHNCTLLPSLMLKAIHEVKKQLSNVVVFDAQFSKAAV